MEQMKVVIFCGGTGTRLREHTEQMPKPMVPIGNKPILWHIMKTYSQHGFKDFILCLGYKSEAIKQYFLNYEWLHHDFTMKVGDRHQWTRHNNHEMEDWNITFAFTGHDTLTAGRLLQVKTYLEGQKSFMFTYGDGVADIDLRALLDFHKKTGKVATITGAHPTSKYGMIQARDDQVITGFQQKPALSDYINIGFGVAESSIFDNIKGRRLVMTDAPGAEETEDRMIEDVFLDLINKQQLAMFQHEGFFHPMDTHKDYEDLNKMWSRGNAPWKVW